MPALDGLAKKISDRSAVVGVVGLGYVGLPLAHSFCQAGYSVIGFDVDAAKVAALDAGEQYLDHLAAAMFSHLHESADFAATTEMSRLAECDAILVAVPTPLGPHQEPDLQYVVATARTIGEWLRAGQLIVLESTTFPGTTREVFSEEIERTAPSSIALGSEFLVAYSPEREDPGRELETTAVPKLVGGTDDLSARLTEGLYGSAFEKVVVVESAEVAEAAKLLENIFRAVNIALVNEMKLVLDALDIDVWSVVEAAATKPYGFMPFYPGPGLGGHCIPIDPFYLSWKAKEVGQPVQFIELAGIVNQRMPTYVVDRLAEGLNRDGKALSQSRVLIIGLAYKAGVGDTRESPTYELIRLIQERRGTVEYHDELAPRTIAGRRFDLGLESVDLDPATIQEFDAVVISTAQQGVSWAMIADNAKLIVDTRNAMAGFEATLGDRLIKA